MHQARSSDAVAIGIATLTFLAARVRLTIGNRWHHGLLEKYMTPPDFFWRCGGWKGGAGCNENRELEKYPEPCPAIFAWNTGFRETKTINQQSSNESVFLQSSKLKPPTGCFKNPTHSGISGCELFRIGPCLSCGNPLLSLNNS